MSKRYYLIAISLLVSLFIYLFYRTEKTLINEIVIRAISLDKYTLLKNQIVSSLSLNDVVIYSLPEGLWIFCITITSRPYFIQWKNIRLDAVVVPLVFCMGLEVFQLLHITNGRFDLMDILISTLFWMLAVFAFRDGSTKQDIMKPLNGMRMICFVSYGIVYLSHVLG